MKTMKVNQRGGTLIVAIGFVLLLRLAIFSPPVVRISDGNAKIVIQTTEVSSHEANRREGICSHFPKHFTAAGIWKENLGRILQASQSPTNPEYSNPTDLKDVLYNILSTERLRKGLRVRPTNKHAALTKVVEILERRLVDDSAPPLHIAVLGGSVTAGSDCWPSYRGLVNKECAWPRRFEYLVNQAVGKDIIKVHNMAVGGTSTGQGNVFVKYWMYAEEIRATGPDVIINSYSTNDALPPSGQTEGVIEAVLRGTRQSLQEFVRLVLRSRRCSPPPMVIHVDDYLGHQNEETLLGELAYNTAMVQVATWYGNMAVSYADAVRDIVYKNTDETTFSANWKMRWSKELKAEVHFSYQGHATVAWVLAYSALEVLSNYCDDYDSQAVSAEAMLETRNLTRSIPPPLDETLKLSEVTQKWEEGPRDAGYEPGMNCTAEQQHNANRNPCVLTWIAAPTGIFDKNVLRNFMKNYTIMNDGWDSLSDVKKNGWAHKLGWEAKKRKATFTMQLKDIPRDVGVITIMYMKSYGEKWANSTTRFTIEDLVLSNRTYVKELVGYHDSQTSISYTERIVLPKTIVKGSTLNLRVDLIGGKTFKISGMMFCSW